MKITIDIPDVYVKYNVNSKCRECSGIIKDILSFSGKGDPVCSHCSADLITGYFMAIEGPCHGEIIDDDKENIISIIPFNTIAKVVLEEV